MSEWAVPVSALPVFILSFWTSSALYEFLRAYRLAGDPRARASTYPIEPEAFHAHTLRPADMLRRTPGLTLGTLVAAARRHPDPEVERLRQRYVFRLVVLIAVILLWLTITVVLFLK